MAIQIGFRVEPEVRLVTARRGPRSPVGPAVRRGDPAPTDPDPDADRFAELAGGGRRQPASRRRRGRRRDRFRDVQTHLDELTALHRAPYDLAHRPVATTGPGAGDAPERAGADGPRSRANAWWERLLDNEPATVTQCLHRAFASRDLGVAVTAVSATDGTADLVFCVDRAEVLIGRWERRDGASTVSRMSRPRRHDLHVAVIGAATLAITAEALAVAPGLGTVRCAVVQPDHPERVPAVLMLAELPRTSVLADDGQPPAIDDLAAATDTGQVRVDVSRSGPAGALAPLDRDGPPVAAVLAALELA